MPFHTETSCLIAVRNTRIARCFRRPGTWPRAGRSGLSCSPFTKPHSRTGVLQGAVAGLSFAALYGVGAGMGYLWTWLGLPAASPQGERRSRLVAIAIAAIIMIYGLSQAPDGRTQFTR